MPRGEVEERVDALAATEEQGVEGRLEAVLAQLRRRARGVRGSVVADASGLPVAVDVREGTRASVLSAMSTLIAQSAGSVFENLGLAGAEFILMEGSQANVAVTMMPEAEVSLLSLVDRTANLGVLKIEMKRAARGIADALGFAFGGRVSISELFILHKSGLLIRHYSDSLRTDLDRDILGGMLVGVQDFVRQTLASKEGSLDQMRYGGYTIFFVRGTDVIAAVVAREGDPEGVQYQVMDSLQEFEERYRSVLKMWAGDPTAFPGIDSCFEKVLRS